MKRRNFLRNFGIGLATIGVAPTLLASTSKDEVLNEPRILVGDKYPIPLENYGRNITLTHKNFGELTIPNPSSYEKFKVGILYVTLKEKWRDDNELIKYPFPMVAITDEIFVVVAGWSIKEECIPFLTNGGLEQDGKKYSCFTKLGVGDVTEYSYIKINNKKYFDNNFLVEVGKNNKVELIGPNSTLDLGKMLAIDEFRAIRYMTPVETAYIQNQGFEVWKNKN